MRTILWRATKWGSLGAILVLTLINVRVAVSTRGQLDKPMRPQVGEILYNATFDLLDDPARHINLHELVASGCRALVFYHSECPACATFAPAWRARASIDSVIPVTWVAVSGTDSGASAFASRYDLPQPILVAPSRDERWRIGVAQWPMVFVVGQSGTLLRVTGLPPDSIDAPKECGARAREGGAGPSRGE